MKNRFGMAAVALAAVLSWGLPAAADGPPAWAYGIDTNAAPAGRGGRGAAPAPDTSLKHLPASTGAFTLTQIRDAFGPADWYPGDHPTMPEIVAKGRRPDVRACALCHYPNGKGRPENAPVAGFTAAYFIQQMADFRNGDRKSAEPRKANTNTMITIAKGMTEDEIKASAEYFAAMKWTPWVKVVEATTVPKTRLSAGMFMPLDGAAAGKEPLGRRIIEVPENPDATDTLRDARSGFIAYVPVGSVKKGEALASSCGVCHGADLNGLGPVPGIAGRSPSYLVRQMYDMQQGARKGPWTQLMKSSVARLSEEDMLDVAAYVASRMP